MRDLNHKPYTEDERRVCDFLQQLTPDIGCGDDPIGFLLASYAYRNHQYQVVVAANQTKTTKILQLQAVLKTIADEDYRGNRPYASVIAEKALKDDNANDL